MRIRPAFWVRVPLNRQMRQPEAQMLMRLLLSAEGFPVRVLMFEILRYLLSLLDRDQYGFLGYSKFLRTPRARQQSQNLS